MNKEAKYVPRYGNSALHYAVSRNNSVVVKLLLETAAKYDLATDRENQLGVTPLSQALECQYDQCVYLLSQAGNVNDSTADTTSVESLTEQRPPTDRMLNGLDVHISGTSKGQTPSGHLLVRRQRSQPGRRSSENGNVIELTGTTFPLDGGYTGRFIRAVSAANLRNQPEYILHMSPRRCFAGEHPCNPLPSATAIEDDDADNWRLQLKQLYTTYGYQFAPSYRKGAPPIDRTLYVDDEYGIPRPISPNSSDGQSDVISELSKRMSRRGSVVSGKFDLPPRVRRNSILGMRNGRTSSTADSSESESSSYAYKPSRKAAASDDVMSTSDKQNKHSKHDKAVAKSGSSRSRKTQSAADKKHADEYPARPVSRTGHHAKDVVSRVGHHPKDVVSRVGHHAKEAATNMNAVADQLSAIKEYQE